ncbi:MAG: hypothetical protein IJ542_01545 [Clostridia bacterium]|nr:hypothetical protein [Clostridia bacterium]
MKLDFNLATFVVGILSLCGVMVNIIFTAQNNKKKRYTELITQRRLNTFQHIIDCSSSCIKAVYGIITQKLDDNTLLQTFVENKSQIFYDTNYKAAAEKDLRNALTKIEDLVVNYIANKETLSKEQKTKLFEVLRRGCDYYQTISCVYCKCEWVRIKETALSVKETVDTQQEYFRRADEIKADFEENKKVLEENTFDKILKI